MPMSSGGSVTHWLDQLKGGDPAAAQNLWERYFQRLVNLANKKLQGLPRKAVDEEDVALSVFDTFFRRAQGGQFPQLSDRNNLWALLIVLTSRKALDVKRHARRLKRGSGNVLEEAALRELADSSASAVGLEQILASEPTPEFAAQVAEETQRLLAGLPDPDLRALAIAKMEGFTNEDIAREMGCALRTVERKLHRIRGIWAKEVV
jgi:DNA-directed RNA polymerase specialized sigma24 family protein